VALTRNDLFNDDPGRGVVASKCIVSVPKARALHDEELDSYRSCWDCGGGAIVVDCGPTGAGDGGVPNDVDELCLVEKGIDWTYKCKQRCCSLED
jgi:hypothetical protein